MASPWGIGDRIARNQREAQESIARSKILDVQAKIAEQQFKDAQREAERRTAEEKFAEGLGIPVNTDSKLIQAIAFELARNPNQYAPTDTEIGGMMQQQGLDVGPPVGIPATMNVPSKLPQTIAEMYMFGLNPLQSAQAGQVSSEGKLQEAKAKLIEGFSSQPGQTQPGLAAKPGATPGMSLQQIAALDAAGLPVREMMEASKSKTERRPSLTLPGKEELVTVDAFGNVVSREPIPKAQVFKTWQRDKDGVFEYAVDENMKPMTDEAGNPIVQPIQEQAEQRTVTKPDGSKVMESVATAGANKGKVVRSVVVEPPMAAKPIGPDQASVLVLPDGSRPKPTWSMDEALRAGAKPDPKMSDGAANKVQLATTALQDLQVFEPLLSADTTTFASEFTKGKLGLGGPMASWRLATENAIRIKSGAAISNAETTRQAVEQYPMNPFMSSEARFKVVERLRAELAGAQRLNDPSGLGAKLMEGGKKQVHVYDPTTKSFRVEER